MYMYILYIYTGIIAATDIIYSAHCHTGYSHPCQAMSPTLLKAGSGYCSTGTIEGGTTAVFCSLEKNSCLLGHSSSFQFLKDEQNSGGNPTLSRGALVYTCAAVGSHATSTTFGNAPQKRPPFARTLDACYVGGSPFFSEAPHLTLRRYIL